MRKKIISVECEFPSYEIEPESFLSDQSLFDADLIIFEPKVLSPSDRYIKHKGKPLLNEEHSVKIREAMEHWQSELTDALKAGKTIIVFLPQLQEFYLTETDELNPLNDFLTIQRFFLLRLSFERQGHHRVCYLLLSLVQYLGRFCFEQIERHPM